jgi:hypothetical protein
MKVDIQTTIETEIKTLKVRAVVRYWEDASVNGEVDTDGKLIPCREGNSWEPVIDIDTGQIINWEKGKTAKINYKICDMGSYYLKDDEGFTADCIENSYVPMIMCPGGNGYGDYIIMNIFADGSIENWRPVFTGFDKVIVD